MRSIHICHVITNTSVGGAEMMLAKVLADIDLAEFPSRVISLMGCGAIGEKIERSGVSVHTLGDKTGRLSNPAAGVARLAQLFWQYRPDVIQTWMYHADLLGGIAAKVAGNLPVAWNIRHSTLDPRVDKLRTRVVARSCALLSRIVPDRIVVNSVVGRDCHIKLGYAANRMQVIPNCFDLDLFCPSETARQAIRSELSLASETRLVGLVGRFHPMKGHYDFLDAARWLISQGEEVHFILCGAGTSHENSPLVDAIRVRQLASRVHLLGVRHDMPKVQASLDVAVSASVGGEGFSNAIGEAMACGVPCVVTNAGDSAHIVGETGIVVPVRDANALAKGCHHLLQLDPAIRHDLGMAARQRIAERYTLRKITAMYKTLWRDLAHRRRRGGVCETGNCFC